MTTLDPEPNLPEDKPHHASRPGSLLPACGVWLAAVTGIVLSIVSVLKVCSACSETAAFSIFGMDFGWFGIAFFAFLTGLLAIRRRWVWADWLVISLLFAAAGAEARFIWLQKYVIGQWCPICLCIAATVYFGSIVKLFETLSSCTSKGVGMKSRIRVFMVITAMAVIGLGGSILGVKKESQAAELDLFLGKTKSPTTVYFISDWFCPGCRKVEPAIEKMYPDIAKLARVRFVDLPIHPETSNFTPYNLQFLNYEKAKYISLRKVLGELSLKTKNPTPEQVKAAIAPLGVKLRPLEMADFLYGSQDNLTIYRGFGVNSTPSVVVTNKTTKKTKILVGESQISEQAVKAAINEVGK